MSISVRLAIPSIAGSFPPWLVVKRNLPLAILGAGGVALGFATTSDAFVQAALTASAALFLVAGCVLAPRDALVGVVVWLSVVAMLRRLLLESGAAGAQDPLLLVAPVTVGVLAALAVRNGAFRRRTQLTTSVMALTGLVALSPLNPFHGGLAVGLAGLLFVLVPLLWFWVGRALVDEALLHRLLTVVSTLAIGAAAYGLVQVYWGFPSWDQTWLDEKGYTALYIGESVRQFASLASTAEYVGLLAIAVILWMLRIRARPVAVVGLSVVMLLTWAIVVASVRGVLVVLPVALGIVFATRRRFSLAKTALAGLAGLVVLGLVVSSINPGTVGGEQTSALLARQVEGIADPFNPEVSTLPIHLTLLLGGIGEVLGNPLGKGLGVVTRAGAIFGGESQNTEADPSNIAVALGFPGLVVYCMIVVLGFRLAFRTARARRDYLSLAALGILLVTTFQWLNGGAYLVAPLPWLVLGWLDQQSVMDGGTTDNKPTPQTPGLLTRGGEPALRV